MDKLSHRLVHTTTDSTGSESTDQAEEIIHLKHENERLKQENSRLHAQTAQDQMKIKSLEQQLRHATSNAIQQELAKSNSSDEHIQLIASLQAELSIVKGSH